VDLYSAIEAFAQSLGLVEVVARERYVLFRTLRIFADLVVMSDCIRLAIHLPRSAAHALFFKVVADRRHVTHVAKLRDPSELDALKPFLREAHAHSTVNRPPMR
jgi:predicted transport protein